MIFQERKENRGTMFFYFLSIFFFLCAVLGLKLRAYTLSHSTSPFVVKGFFEIGSCGTICLGWLRTVILLISAS
jgi:hypothetical protein